MEQLLGPFPTCSFVRYTKSLQQPYLDQEESVPTYKRIVDNSSWSGKRNSHSNQQFCDPTKVESAKIMRAENTEHL